VLTTNLKLGRILPLVEMLTVTLKLNKIKKGGLLA